MSKVKDGQQLMPLKLENPNKFINLASHYFYNISITLSVDNVYYVWGKCGHRDEDLIKEPKEIEFKSFNEIFDKYLGINYQIMRFSNKTINIQNLNDGKYKKKFEEKDLIGSEAFGIVCKSND
jgi:hypothetical protein